MTACVVEFRKQLISGLLIRQHLFLCRVQIDTTQGKALVWVPSWRVVQRGS